jgi:hypothetical protein
MVARSVKNEVEGMGKEAVINWFEILHRFLPVGSRMNHEKPEFELGTCRI